MRANPLWVLLIFYLLTIIIPAFSSEMPNRVELLEEEWETFYDLLLNPPVYVGSLETCRCFLNAVLWILRSRVDTHRVPLGRLFHPKRFENSTRCVPCPVPCRTGYVPVPKIVLVLLFLDHTKTVTTGATYPGWPRTKISYLH